jgi:hypothetical protein
MTTDNPDSSSSTPNTHTEQPFGTDGIQIQIEVGIPMWSSIPGALSRLKRIVTLDRVPESGDLFRLPIGLSPEVSDVDEILGHPRVVIHGAHLLQAMPKPEDLSDYSDVSVVYQDLRAHGYSGVTEWDWDLANANPEPPRQD